MLADAVLVAVAAGTFIYVGATEVIAEEFESPHDKWKKFFALSGMPAEVCGDPNRTACHESIDLLNSRLPNFFGVLVCIPPYGPIHIKHVLCVATYVEGGRG